MLEVTQQRLAEPSPDVLDAVISVRTGRRAAKLEDREMGALHGVGAWRRIPEEDHDTQTRRNAVLEATVEIMQHFIADGFTCSPTVHTRGELLRSHRDSEADHRLIAAEREQALGLLRCLSDSIHVRPHDARLIVFEQLELHADEMLYGRTIAPGSNHEIQVSWTTRLNTT